ncbi:MAG: hypothetical protein KKD77_20265 [Gammaproteobacteria bacterium]|nr:hypothetical protein [Gammaproteobacteria bacterium]
MGIIFSNAFVDVLDASITARSQAAGYVKANVMDRNDMKRRFRADDVTANDYLLKFNFGAAQALVGVFLNDVTFNKVKIQGHASDAWGAPTYPGTDLTVSQNAITGRYQIYIPLTAFSYQYLRIFIPSGTTAVGDYTTKWEIGTVCFLSSVTTLSKDMAYGYGQTGRHFYNTAINERISTGEEIRWEGNIVFGNRSTDYESELWTVNRMDMSLPFVYYENNGNTANAYLCVRDDSIETTRLAPNVLAGNTIKIKEAYMIEGK